MQIKEYGVAPYLVLATANGQVKKTRLADFDSPRSGGVIAINLRESDELVGAALIDPEQDLLLRSEEHTSELQSRQYLVCRLLLEKKKGTVKKELVDVDGVAMFLGALQTGVYHRHRSLRLSRPRRVLPLGCLPLPFITWRCHRRPA